MTPSYEELLHGSTRWRLEHKGVSYLLNHHGYRNGGEFSFSEPHPGTWCFYLLLPEQMYPHRWADFAVTRKENGYECHGPAWDHDWFHSGITWSSSEPYWCRKTERLWDGAKVGCDYNHLWDGEAGYPDTFESVKRDAQRAVDALLTAHPDRRLKSGYSHRWGEPDDFYTAINGALVHKEDEIPDSYDKWQPAEASA